jgi:hypothetical protein
VREYTDNGQHFQDVYAMKVLKYWFDIFIDDAQAHTCERAGTKI